MNRPCGISDATSAQLQAAAFEIAALVGTELWRPLARSASFLADRLAGIVLAVVFGALAPTAGGRDVAHLWILATAVTLVLADFICVVLSRHDDDPLTRRLGMQLAGAAAAGMCSVFRTERCCRESPTS